MFTISKLSILPAAGAFIAFGGYGLPVLAEELAQHLGPVGPHKPILTTVGSKGVIAFYEPDGGNCGLNVVVWDRADESGVSAARMRISLKASQTVHIDSPDNQSLNLQCGDYADTLKIVDSKLVTAETAR